MECSLIEGELVPFHFGTLEGVARASVEEHLCGCARCLSSFLELKRSIEVGSTGRELTRRPSAGLRARLRADVAAEFALKRGRRRVLGGVAALAAAAALVGVLWPREPKVTAPPARAPEISSPSETVPATEAVDTARPVAAGPQFL